MNGVLVDGSEVEFENSYKEMSEKLTLEKLNYDILVELKKANVELSPNSKANVYSDRIYLFVVDDNGESIFGSSLDVTATKLDKLLNIIKKSKISFGTTGSFDPNSLGDYWRTIHAASILKNWDAVIEIVNLFCDEYNKILNSVS